MHVSHAIQSGLSQTKRVFVLCYMSWWLTQCCYVALLPNAQLSPDLGLKRQRAVLEGSAWNSLGSASCWPGSFWSTVDREADSARHEVTWAENTSRRVIPTVSCGGNVEKFDESAGLSLPPGTNLFSCIWQTYTQHMAALVSAPFNLSSTPPIFCRISRSAVPLW